MACSVNGDGFLCSKADLRETRELQRQQKQESEANRFAIELLAPPALFDAGLSAEPDLQDAARLRTRLDISLEATVRRMIDRRPERLGAVFSKSGVVRYCDRSREFPFITCRRGHSVPKDTAAFRAGTNSRTGITSFAETHGIAWTQRPGPVAPGADARQAKGFCVTLLWADSLDRRSTRRTAV